MEDASSRKDSALLTIFSRHFCPLANNRARQERRNNGACPPLAQITRMPAHMPSAFANRLREMGKRHPHSETIASRSGPDRRSLLVGTASTAAVPVFARGAHAAIVSPSTNADKLSAVDVTLTINDREHSLAVDVRTSLLDLLRERLGLTGAKKG